LTSFKAISYEIHILNVFYDVLNTEYLVTLTIFSKRLVVVATSVHRHASALVSLAFRVQTMKNFLFFFSREKIKFP
jgi:hypothetical protein